MLIKRIVTAIIGVIAATYIINYGQWLFALAAGVIALLAWREFCKMFAAKSLILWDKLGVIGIILLLGCSWAGNSQEINMVVLLLTLLTIGKTVFDSHYNIVHAAITLLGIVYIGLAFSHLILLRFTDHIVIASSMLGSLSAGTVFIWIAFIGTWANDTVAFFVGSNLGKHKLCPAISPGKTIEGAVGGAAGGIIVIALLGILLKFSLLHSVMIGLLIGLAAPLGDLAESAIKRFAGVKDSGNILPGHGGILDRFDSIMFVVPVVYYYMQFFIV
ncbi:CDP-archaeol synthase|uniref:Phosphatidate cytidylyltransferase n=1 Tax=Dendrosporobacter quercicolus TaxID=146817 RepID=A0A1G9MFH9_9FIRM|nr:phosphatidate cytidylyltransferase [Dendrosporobacter quercicolus]NSL47023.1 CDP-archaeol synthase [Dendrosporobacter quercicolus DSM 1736]SDL73022.1 phosphatidate cytidylyltransferase [Dendrosporobacter quercicolus]